MAPLSTPSWYDGGLIDIRQRSLWVTVASILFNPIYWNSVARNELRHHTLTRLFGSPYRGCYALGLSIFLLGLLRDSLFLTALSHQPSYPSSFLSYAEIKLLALGLFTVGGMLVLSSMYALGVTGTYLGDYFGILMDGIVENFPFSVCKSPMYTGSTMGFAATALWHESPAGLLLTALVYFVYKVALWYEDPFTAAIYAARNKRQINGASSPTSKRITAASSP